VDDAEAFRWVTEEQARYLEDSSTSAWQSEWPTYLVRYLDQTWSGWRDETEDHLNEWLEPRVRTVGLGWVSAEQRVQLDTLGDWREWLPVQLDTWWSDWSQADAATLIAWLDQAMPSLMGTPDPGEETGQVQEDLRDLTWVTAAQLTRLEQVDEQDSSRGPWRVWLPTQLDEWWPGWDQSDEATMQAWFEQAIESLEAPSVAADEASLAAESTPIPADEVPDALIAVLRQQNPELDEFDDNELHELLAEVVAEYSAANVGE
jgi:hypothetical protein